ncbi:MAG: hypothetical protein QM820_06425 [Minicystis sp.]
MSAFSATITERRGHPLLIYLMFVALALFTLTGCGMPSRNAFFPSAARTSDDFIVGTWFWATHHDHLQPPAGGFSENKLVVSKGGSGEYVIEYYEDTRDAEKARHPERFRATMTEIAGDYYLDFRVDPDSPSERNQYFREIYGDMHGLARISERRLDDCELHISVLDTERAAQLAASQGLRLESVMKAPGQYEKVFAAPTDQLHEFLKRNHGDPTLFRRPYVFQHHLKHVIGICRPFTLDRGWNFSPAIEIGDSVETGGKKRWSFDLGFELGLIRASRKGSLGAFVEGLWALERKRATVSIGPRYMYGIIGADVGYMIGFGGHDDVAHGVGLRARVDFKYVALYGRFGAMVGGSHTVDFGLQVRWPRHLPW